MNRIEAVLLSALLVLLVPAESFAAAMTPCGDAGLEAPAITAKAALLYAVDTDEMLFTKNADKKCDPYSITKLVTAYLAAESLDMNMTVAVSEDAANDLEGGSTMELLAGEKVTIEQLLYGTLMLSGNDAAYQLAETTSGSVGAFVKKMNSTVKEWGCTGTHFTNPMGLQDEKHYTTANDLLIIAQHALSNDIVRSIAFTRTYKMPATAMSEKRVMKNHTTLVRNKNYGVLGGKTGFWEEDDCSVVLEANKDQLTTILVLLKDTAKGRDKDAKKLLKYANKKANGYVVDKAGADTGTDSTWRHL